MKFVVVCYILRVEPLFRIINGFIRKVEREFGLEKIGMMDNGVFMVRFRTI